MSTDKNDLLTLWYNHEYIQRVTEFFSTTYPCWIDRIMAKFRTSNGNVKSDLFSTPLAWLRKREMEIFKGG